MKDWKLMRVWDGALSEMLCGFRYKKSVNHREEREGLRSCMVHSFPQRKQNKTRQKIHLFST